MIYISIVRDAICGRFTEILLTNSISLIHFKICSWTWELKFNFESNTITKCFWLGHLAMLLLLNLIGRSETFAESDLREKITCLFIGIRVKLHFPFKGPLAIFF